MYSILKSMHFNDQAIKYYINIMDYVKDKKRYSMKEIYEYTSKKYCVTEKTVVKILQSAINNSKLSIQNRFNYYNKITIKVFIELLSQI